MYRQTSNELRRLIAELGDDGEAAWRPQRLASVEMSMEDKLFTVGFMNLHTGRINEPTRRYAGPLPLQRLGTTPCVSVNASPSWITGGVHIAKNMPSFKEFCAQRRNEEN